MSYKLINEGNTYIYTSEDNFTEKDPKTSNEVFYNPNMELNRDITIAALSIYKKDLIEKKKLKKKDITYVDAFAASGIRGIRAAKELGFFVNINDLKKELIGIMNKNVRINNVEELVKITNYDANLLLLKEKASIVDIDPFGSPSRYLDAAISSAKYFLNVTATDTASLCGAHLNSGIRKYLSFPQNSEFHAELGLRILLGYICRSMAKYNKYMNVLFSHVTRHYVRCYLEVNYGISKVNQEIKKYIGYVIFCKNCGSITTKSGLVIFSNELCTCGYKYFISGPLWLGPLKQNNFCLNIIKECNVLKLNKKKDIIKLIESCLNEIETPFYYNYHTLCKKLKLSAIKIDDIIFNLIKIGYEASRTHITGVGIKTNAPINIINDIILTISKKNENG